MNENEASRLQAAEAPTRSVKGMETTNEMDVTFCLGKLRITPGAMKELSPMEVLAAVGRHSRGDWGEIDEGDRGQNEFSLRENLRLFSVYRSGNDRKFWVITEHDRSITTILLPEEY